MFQHKSIYKYQHQPFPILKHNDSSNILLLQNQNSNTNSNRLQHGHQQLHIVAICLQTHEHNPPPPGTLTQNLNTSQTHQQSFQSLDPPPSPNNPHIHKQYSRTSENSPTLNTANDRKSRGQQKMYGQLVDGQGHGYRCGYQVFQVPYQVFGMGFGRAGRGALYGDVSRAVGLYVYQVWMKNQPHLLAKCLKTQSNSTTTHKYKNNHNKNPQKVYSLDAKILASLGLTTSSQPPTKSNQTNQNTTNPIPTPQNEKFLSAYEQAFYGLRGGTPADQVQKRLLCTLINMIMKMKLVNIQYVKRILMDKRKQYQQYQQYQQQQQKNNSDKAINSDVCGNRYSIENVVVRNDVIRSLIDGQYERYAIGRYRQVYIKEIKEEVDRLHSSNKKQSYESLVSSVVHSYLEPYIHCPQANTLPQIISQIPQNPQSPPDPQSHPQPPTPSPYLTYPPTPQCPNCLQYLLKQSPFPYQHLTEPFQQNIVLIPEFRMTNGQFGIQERSQLEQAICGVLNEGAGYVFVGVERDGRVGVRGVQVTRGGMESFGREVRKLVKSYVGPSQQVSQIMQNDNFNRIFVIDYLPVLNNINKLSNQPPSTQQSHQQNSPIPPPTPQPHPTKQHLTQKLFQGLYTIRIRIELPPHLRKYLYYINTPSLSSNKDQFQVFEMMRQERSLDVLASTRVEFRVALVEERDVYGRILGAYGKFRRGWGMVKGVGVGGIEGQGNGYGIYGHQRHIKCMKPLYIDQQVTNKIFKNLQLKSGKLSETSNFFGRNPTKKFDHESLIIVSQAGITDKTLQRFIQNLSQKKISFQYYQIYQKLKTHKISPRHVFYLTHQKKFQTLQKLIPPDPSPKPKLLLFDIRKQFILLDHARYPEALAHLKNTFKLEFNANISHGGRKFYNPKIKDYVQECYFQFAHKIYAVFAFVALEYRNVRCNFVNSGKLDGIHMVDD